MSNAVTNPNIVTFITTDPRGVGFAAIRTANPGQDAPLIAAANNNTGPGAGTKPGNAMAANAVFALIDAAELGAMTAAQQGEWNQFVQAAPMLMGNAGWQADLNNLFADFPISLAAIQATYTQPASPWEMYFGAGQQATIGLLDAARNSNGGSQF